MAGRATDAVASTRVAASHLVIAKFVELSFAWVEVACGVTDRVVASIGAASVFPLAPL